MTERTPPTSGVQLLEVEPELAGQRIDNFLITALKGVPKTLIYRILRKGEVRVNKGRIKPEYKLQAGDIVRVPPVRLPERDEPVPVAQGLLQRLVFEDNRGLEPLQQALCQWHRFVALRHANRRHAHDIARLQLVFGLDPAFVHSHFAFTQNAVNQGLGHAFEPSEKEVVNSLAGIFLSLIHI